MPPLARITVAIGPVMPGWGSWDWVGTSLVEKLGDRYPAATFEPWQIPAADAVVVVKHAPPAGWVDGVAGRSAVVYCPIDHYGAAAEIGADSGWLERCARVLVHCRRLRPHFASAACADEREHRNVGRVRAEGRRIRASPLGVA